MTTFQSRIIQCPNCKLLMSTYELTSYFVRSSVAYSDGKIDCNPPRMDDKKILICSDCNKEFWRDDTFLNSEDVNISYNEIPDAKDFHDLTFAFDSDYSFKLATYFSKLLEKGFAHTVEKEVYLRIKLWHLLNNDNRYDPDSIIGKLIKNISGKHQKKNFPDHDNVISNKLFESNLEELINIYKPENEEMNLMLAEMHRELGDFKQALLVLEKIEKVDNKVAYNKIKAAAKRKKTKVLKLN